MTTELSEFLAGRLPLRITDVEFHDPAFVLVGEEWSAAFVCPWRLMRGGLLVTSIDDPSAERQLRELIGQDVRSVVASSERADAQDPALVLSDGSRLEIFADSDLDPWSFSIDGTTFVGSASARP